MNAWPTLQEWFQFSGTLALELTVVFAVAKLAASRVRSAQGRRALWQIAMLALLLVSVGELSGVRGWMRRSERKAPASQTKVVVTFRDVEPSWEEFRDAVTAEAPPAVVTPQRPSCWQQRAVWPALLWAMVAGLVLFRMLIAQVMVIALRLTWQRSSGQRCSLDDMTAEETADMAVRCSERVQRIAQMLGIRRRVVLFTSARTVAPFTFGVARPVIVLPRSFATTFTPEQQDAALAHELAHVAGFDSAWRCLGQFGCAVLWWFPLVWLARRELDHASELVADEASLLVANGPDCLAECLLACAKELRRPALVGWLGMDGGGFRSALGQRVTRLLQLHPHARLSRPVPWYLRLVAPIAFASLLWLGMSLVLKSGEPRGGAWRSSILGSAFAAVAENKVKATVEPAKTNQVARLREVDPKKDASTNAAGMRALSDKRQAIYQKLRSIRLSEWGPIDRLPLSEVIRGLSEGARRADPEHTGIDIILSPTLPGAALTVDSSDLPVKPPEINLNRVVVRLGSKLKDLTLEDILNIIIKVSESKLCFSVEDFGIVISPESAEAKPLHTRIFHVEAEKFQKLFQDAQAPTTNALTEPNSTHGGTTTNRAGGISFLSEAPTTTVISGVRKFLSNIGVNLADPGKALFFNDRLGLLMIRATLEDLDAIEKAFQSLDIMPGTAWSPGSVEKTNASPSTPRSDLSESPTNSTALQTRFFRVDPMTFEQTLKSVSIPDFKSGKVKLLFDKAQGTNALLAKVQIFLEKTGVDLSAPDKSLFFNDQTGALMVRATVRDLDVVEKAIQMLNMSPPQVSIRIKAMEVPVTTNQGAAVWFQRLGTNIAPTGQAFTSQVASVTGILTSEQYRQILSAMEKSGGVDLMNAPEVTTLSGRQAQIKVVDIRYIVTDLDASDVDKKRANVPLGPKGGATVTREPGSLIVPVAEPFELGPVVDVVPYVNADGRTIQMTVLPSLKEFLGYDDPGTVKPAGAGMARYKETSTPMPLPKFRLRQSSTVAQIWDGQTMIVGAGTVRNAERDRATDGTVTTNYTDKALFFFITPRIIDPAGNPVHSDEELREMQKNVSPPKDSPINSGLRGTKP